MEVLKHIEEAHGAEPDSFLRATRLEGTTERHASAHTEQEKAEGLDDDEDAVDMVEKYHDTGAPSPDDGVEPLPQPDPETKTWKYKLKIRVPYYIPVLSWLPRYNLKQDLAKDLVAGVGVAAMLIPQCIGCALLAGVPANMALYTAVFPLLLYFVFGTSKQLSIGPDVLSSLMVGTVLSHHELSYDASEIVTVFAFVGGATILALGLMRLGFIDNILSRPLLAGFVNAVATLILWEQTDTFFGVGRAKNHGILKLVEVFGKIKNINWPTVGIGSVTLVILYTFKFLKKKHWAFKLVPEMLICVLAGCLLDIGQDVTRWGVKILGNVQKGFLSPQMPPLEMISEDHGIATSAITMAVIGFIEHIVVAKFYANKHNYSISPNREMVALGVSNFLSSFFHTYPTCGALARSGVANALGARSQLFSLVTAFVMILCVLLLGPFFYHLPVVIASAVMIMASIGLFEFEDIQFLWRIRAKLELVLVAITYLSTVFIGVEEGIYVSLGVSILIILKRSTVPFVTILGKVKDREIYSEVTQLETRVLPGIMMLRIDGPLFFANVSQIKRLFARVEKLGDPKAHPAERAKNPLPPTRAVVIHARNVLNMDANAVQVMHEMVEEYHRRHVLVTWVKLRDHIKKVLVAAKVIEDYEGENCFDTVPEAVHYCHEKMHSSPHGIPSVSISKGEGDENGTWHPAGTPEPGEPGMELEPMLHTMSRDDGRSSPASDLSREDNLEQMLPTHVTGMANYVVDPDCADAKEVPLEPPKPVDFLRGRQRSSTEVVRVRSSTEVVRPPFSRQPPASPERKLTPLRPAFPNVQAFARNRSSTEVQARPHTGHVRSNSDSSKRATITSNGDAEGDVAVEAMPTVLGGGTRGVHNAASDDTDGRDAPETSPREAPAQPSPFAMRAVFGGRNRSQTEVRPPMPRGLTRTVSTEGLNVLATPLTATGPIPPPPASNRTRAGSGNPEEAGLNRSRAGSGQGATALSSPTALAGSQALAAATPNAGARASLEEGPFGGDGGKDDEKDDSEYEVHYSE